MRVCKSACGAGEPRVELNRRPHRFQRRPRPSAQSARQPGVDSTMIGRPKFVLASGSPRRVSLINQAGIEPDELRPANIDETPKRGELPRVCANRLAHAKAETALAGIGAGDEALAIDPERRHQNEMLTDVNAVAHVE